MPENSDLPASAVMIKSTFDWIAALLTSGVSVVVFLTEVFVKLTTAFSCSALIAKSLAFSIVVFLMFRFVSFC